MLTRLLVAPVVAAATLAGCGPSGTEQQQADAPVPSPDATGSGSAPGATESPSGDPVADALAEHDPSLADYFDRAPAASALQLGQVRSRTATQTSYDVSFRSEGLRITGVVDVPTGPGPFPAVVLAHGWIDPEVYVQGQGMNRERDHFARGGHVALHVDYRNHAGSDDDPGLVEQMYLGYAADVLAAVAALRASDLPVEDDRVALVGRSMGGSVVLQALEMLPGYVEAGVVYSGQSSLESENYVQWGGPGASYAADYVRRHGTPAEDPLAWRAVSTRPYFSRVTEPVLMVHGTRDEQCPPRWARATRDALARADVDVRLRWYDDQHAFSPRFEDSMRDIDTFLDRHLT
ncbi:hypothetical protein ASG49_00115 [Marmoricola sp. Leaf446]|nr:hypothetical protein ASG49_00115 [Marmoricola sp. Leaf446]